MATLDEKTTGLQSVDHHDDVPNVDHVVHIAHETEGKTSPWTWNMFRLYLVLAVAYLCGYVITPLPRKKGKWEAWKRKPTGSSSLDHRFRRVTLLTCVQLLEWL
jgi:hypothetical protein